MLPYSIACRHNQNFSHHCHHQQNASQDFVWVFLVVWGFCLVAFVLFLFLVGWFGGFVLLYCFVLFQMKCSQEEADLTKDRPK